MRSKFPERLTEVREMRGWNKTELSVYSGIERSLIGRYEKGSYEPTLSTLIALAEGLDVSADYLIGLTDHKWEQKRAPTLSPEARIAARIIDGYESARHRQYLLTTLEQAARNMSNLLEDIGERNGV